MKKPKFTPGPYEIGHPNVTGPDDGERYNASGIYASTGVTDGPPFERFKCIASVYNLFEHCSLSQIEESIKENAYGCAKDMREALATAHLLKAAPEMYEALEQFLECCPCQNNCAPDDMTCATRRAEAALKKARAK